MRYVIAFFSVSLLVLPMLFSQSGDARENQNSQPCYLGMVFALEGDRLIIPDGFRKTNGNYLLVEDATGRKIDRTTLHMPCEVMVEYEYLPKGEKVVVRLIILKYYDEIGGRLVPQPSF
jgi:hypothetical protein